MIITIRNEVAEKNKHLAYFNDRLKNSKVHYDENFFVRRWFGRLLTRCGAMAHTIVITDEADAVTCTCCIDKLRKKGVLK